MEVYHGVAIYKPSFARDLLSMKCCCQCIGLSLSMHSCSHNWMDGCNEHHHSERRRRTDGMMREREKEEGE